MTLPELLAKTWKSISGIMKSSSLVASETLSATQAKSRAPNGLAVGWFRLV